MGVRGLTSYIAKRAEKFLEPYELHDTDLVIDGDNLASQLFKKTEHRLCAFGGNYDSYFATVVAFFAMLKKCNVKPYVLLDGGYEQKKMKTVRDRLLGRISSVKNIRILEGKRLAIPLMMREVFVDAMRQSNVSFYRCMFEADDEIAILARKLKCPVFSYDSDFYIHNVLYIPNVTLTHKVYKKTVKNEKNYEIQIINKSKSKRSRQNMKKVVVQDKMGPPIDDTPVESYYYMDCSIYQIENLVAQRKLGVEMVPLFACLIGNDYVERRMFRKFYASIKLQRNNKNCTPQQQRIEKMFEWLRNETLQSAMGKIIERMKQENRKPLIRQIKAAISGYSSEQSEAFAYFGLEEVKR
jgi:5'-3' exonuclease